MLHFHKICIVGVFRELGIPLPTLFMRFMIHSFSSLDQSGRQRFIAHEHEHERPISKL